ncbi:MAG: hypothetical protein JNM93_05790 [Bacteriovoracaceae bacterium]|nr:hypothetical protein [Bacteriovoracaceae bacterium]
MTSALLSIYDVKMENKKELAQQLHHQVVQTLGTKEGLHKYITQTLKSFAYRYLPHETEVQAPMPDLLLCQAFEADASKAAQCQDSKAAAAIKQLKPPSVMSLIMVNTKEFKGDKKGSIEIVSVIHWGAPDFQPNSPKQKVKKVIFNFNDVMEFRNDFANYLEQVCEIF